ncbi:MAG: hypothetical protein EAY81_12075 [Bacteroidetes bacterium]|nr:MAG: hypothetical protein EAY81_12075 [Bacteroidota bacterium]
MENKLAKYEKFSLGSILKLISVPANILLVGTILRSRVFHLQQYPNRNTQLILSPLKNYGKQIG